MAGASPPPSRTQPRKAVSPFEFSLPIPRPAAKPCRWAAHRKTHQHCLTSIMIETVYFLKMAMVNDAL